MVARLTRPLDEFECRIAGGCPLEEWLDNHNVEDYESEYFCRDCPFEIYINRLAEYEDGSVIE